MYLQSHQVQMKNFTLPSTYIFNNNYEFGQVYHNLDQSKIVLDQTRHLSNFLRCYVRVATAGKAPKAQAFPGFCRTENGNASGSTPLMCPSLWRPCLPKIGHGGPDYCDIPPIQKHTVKTRSMRTTTNCYLVSLAVADTITLIVSVPQEVISYHILGDRWVWGSVGCTLMIYLQVRKKTIRLKLPNFVLPNFYIINLSRPIPKVRILKFHAQYSGERGQKKLGIGCWVPPNSTEGSQIK